MAKRGLEEKLASTQSELELSTFLNKGILATNNELRVRIAELESENKILKTAENRLAKTEDELDQARQTIDELQKELDAFESDFQKEIRREQDARGLMQEERDLLWKEVEWRRLAFAGFEKALAWSEENKPVALRKKEQQGTAEERRGGRGSLGATRTSRLAGGRRDVQITDPTSVTKSLSRRAAAVNVRRDAYLESPSPEGTPKSAFKRRRIQLSPDDEDEHDVFDKQDDLESDEEDLAPPPRKTPTRRASVSRHVATSSTLRDRSSGGPTSRRKDLASSTSKRRESRRSSPRLPVKEEQRSPPNRRSPVSVVDSEEDPLAMH